MGNVVATHQQAERGVVPCKCTRKQHEKPLWLQGLPLLNFFLLLVYYILNEYLEAISCSPIFHVGGKNIRTQKDMDGYKCLAL